MQLLISNKCAVEYIYGAPFLILNILRSSSPFHWLDWSGWVWPFLSGKLHFIHSSFHQRGFDLKTIKPEKQCTWKGGLHMTNGVSINFFAMLPTNLFELIITHTSLIQSVPQLDHIFPLHNREWGSISLHSKYMGTPSPKQQGQALRPMRRAGNALETSPKGNSTVWKRYLSELMCVVIIFPK